MRDGVGEDGVFVEKPEGEKPLFQALAWVGG
jgi:hypothetical protein